MAANGLHQYFCQHSFAPVGGGECSHAENILEAALLVTYSLEYSYLCCCRGVGPAKGGGGVSQLAPCAICVFVYISIVLCFKNVFLLVLIILIM